MRRSLSPSPLHLVDDAAPLTDADLLSDLHSLDQAVQQQIRRYVHAVARLRVSASSRAPSRVSRRAMALVSPPAP